MAAAANEELEGARGDRSPDPFSHLRWREGVPEDQLKHVDEELACAVRDTLSVAGDHTVCLAAVLLNDVLHLEVNHDCCTACGAGALAGCVWLSEDKDFMPTNKTQGFVCCGVGDDEGCLGSASQTTAAINEVLAWVNGADQVGKRYPSPARLRFSAYNAWLRLCLPETPAAGERGQVALPLCVVLRIRASFPNPLEVPYKGRPNAR